MLDITFEFDPENATAKDVVKKIMELPVADRIRPNFLGHHVRNSSMVVIDDYVSKLSKSIVKVEADTFVKPASKNATGRTKSKLLSNVVKPVQSVKLLYLSSLSNSLLLFPKVVLLMLTLLPLHSF